MLPLKNRLKNSTEIKQVFEGGKSTRSDFLFLRFKRNNTQLSRIAFSIGLNHSKKAVERNRTKRILRSATKELLTQIKPGFDIVVYVKNIKPEDIKLDVAKTSLHKALILAKILKQ